MVVYIRDVDGCCLLFFCTLGVCVIVVFGFSVFRGGSGREVFSLGGFGCSLRFELA